MMILFLIFTLLIMALWYLIASTAIIPENHVGIPSIFGDRFYFGRAQIRIMREGLRWRPFPKPFSKVAIYSLARDIDRLDVETFTRYGTTQRKGSERGETAKAIFSLTMEWQPHQNPELLRRFIELSAEASSTDNSTMDPAVASVQDALKDILGKMSSQVDPGDVVDLRNDFANLLNIYVRGELQDWEKVANFFSLSEEEQEQKQEHVKDILKKIDDYDLTPDQNDPHVSQTEKRLGVRIFRINITKIAFAPETERAIHSKIEKAAIARGSEAQWKKKIELAREIEGINPEHLKEVSVTMGESQRVIVDSGGGQGPVIPIIQLGSGPRPPRQEGGKGKKGKES